MCGILAVFCNYSLPQEKVKKVLESSEYLGKRGPDTFTHIVRNDGVYIFHRLSINDTSSYGDQPMKEGKVLMMCNGEIYNHKELEEKFNLVCSSKSDCEAIIKLYEHMK